MNVGRATMLDDPNRGDGLLRDGKGSRCGKLEGATALVSPPIFEPRVSAAGLTGSAVAMRHLARAQAAAGVSAREATKALAAYVATSRRLRTVVNLTGVVWSWPAPDAHRPRWAALRLEMGR